MEKREYSKVYIGDGGGDHVMDGSDAPGSEAPLAIPFPFPPYDVQTRLMRKIYDTLERGGIGVFESPTGTGKSLSVICSALQWLKDAEARDVDSSSDGAAGSGSNGGVNEKNASDMEENGGSGEKGVTSSWLDDYTQETAQKERETRSRRVREKRQDLFKRLDTIREEQKITDQGRKFSTAMSARRGRAQGWKPKGTARKAFPTTGTSKKRPRPKDPPSTKATGEVGEDGSGTDKGDEEFLVGEYDSGAEGGSGAGDRESSSDEEEEEQKRGGKWVGGRQDEDDWKDLGLRQILYCSRTHSQTSQFVNEVKKTAFAEGVRCASLGSRRTLCGNERVSSLKSDARMTDACLELQKKKKKNASAKSNKKHAGKVKSNRASLPTPNGRGGDRDVDNRQDRDASDDDDQESTSDGCPLLAADGQKEFRYRALASVRDIEELAELGKRDGTCAYYGVRKAAALAQLVVMPYAALLSRETREAMGVRLEGAVVVVDEAHNIVEAINSVHSKRVTLSEVARAHSQLSQYEAKYGSRLKGRNAFYVGNILKLLRALINHLKRGRKKLQAIRAREGVQDGSSPKPRTTLSAPNSTPKNQTNGRVPSGTSKQSGLHSAPTASRASQSSGGGEEEESARSEMLEINDFLFRAGVDNVNIFRLQRYMRRSEICRKLMGFMDFSATCSPEVAVGTKLSVAATDGAIVSGEGTGGVPGAGNAGSEVEESSAFVSKHVSALQTVEMFLNALTNASRDGRVLVTYGGKSANAGGGQQGVRQQQRQDDDEEPSVKFLMLNPSVHFDEIVKKARALVLVGGTMQPTGDLVRQLFSTVAPERVEVFSCGHVIPKQNLLPLCVSRGPSNKTFNFTFHKRGTHEQMDELGKLMINVCKFVPGGVVCFLASYGYLDQVVARWKESGALGHLSKVKSLFSEPRSAKDVDAVLRDFTFAAKAGARNASASGSGVGGKGGALLLSVVGAKMSEGINFSDDLARCVVMVGLPYPDKRDPELKQKMAYLDKADPKSRGRAGRDYYSSICMRAVNQSIGRSIRHAGDYASILLLDERYKDDQVVKLLPGWIAERVEKPANFGACFKSLRGFFNAMKIQHAS